MPLPNLSFPNCSVRRSKRHTLVTEPRLHPGCSNPLTPSKHHESSYFPCPSLCTVRSRAPYSVPHPLASSSPWPPNVLPARPPPSLLPLLPLISRCSSRITTDQALPALSHTVSAVSACHAVSTRCEMAFSTRSQFGSTCSTAARASWYLFSSTGLPSSLAISSDLM